MLFKIGLDILAFFKLLLIITVYLCFCYEKD